MARTLQRLDPEVVFMARAVLVALAACPATPVRDVVEALVELVVLEVALGHQAHVAGGIDKQVKVNRAGGGGGARRPVLIHSSDWAAGGLIVRKSRGR